MDLVNFYQIILAPPVPWRVARVEMSPMLQRVDVWLEHEVDFQFICPVCHKPGIVCGHTEEQIWRHLDSCDCQTYLHAKFPRIKCPKHGVQTGDFKKPAPKH